MSDDGPTEGESGKGKRRRKGRGRKAISWPVIGGVALGALLLVNLVMGLTGLFGEDAEPSGFVTMDMVRWVGLWLPVAIIVGMSLQALRWTTLADRRSDGGGVNWARWGFLAALLAAAVQLWGMYEQDDQGGYLLKRQDFVFLCVIAQALIVSLFALGARSRLGGGGSGGRRRRRRSSSDDDGWAQLPPRSEAGSTVEDGTAAGTESGSARA